MIGYIKNVTIEEFIIQGNADRKTQGQIQIWFSKTWHCRDGTVCEPELKLLKKYTYDLPVGGTWSKEGVIKRAEAEKFARRSRAARGLPQPGEE